MNEDVDRSGEPGRLWAVACVYGLEYLPLVATFLESWSRFVDKIIIVHEGAISSPVRRLALLYKNVEAVERAETLSLTRDVRVSQKMMYWEYLNDILCERISDLDAAIFADIDTLALRSVREMVDGDIVVTVRSPESRIALNSGVIALSRMAVESDFMRNWAHHTRSVLADPLQLQAALNPDGPYGGGDQKALMDVLGITSGSVPERWAGLRLKAVECAEFNACENQVDLSVARVLHLKASIQAYLLRRHPFTGARRPMDAAATVKLALGFSDAARVRLIGDANLSRSVRFKLPYGARADCSVPCWSMAITRSMDRLRSGIALRYRRIKMMAPRP